MGSSNDPACSIPALQRSQVPSSICPLTTIRMKLEEIISNEKIHWLLLHSYEHTIRKMWKQVPEGAEINRLSRLHDCFHTKTPYFPLATIIINKSKYIENSILRITLAANNINSECYLLRPQIIFLRNESRAL